MVPGRKLRKRLSIGLIGMLLLMQCLVLAHACVRAMPAAAQVHAGCGEAGAVLAATDQGAAQDEALCGAHCKNDQSLPAAQADGSLSSPSPGWFVVAPPALPMVWPAATAAHGLAPTSGTPPGWPPLYLQHQVLRN